jgi:polyhydroxyalkanoate synthesis regulator phasin
MENKDSERQSKPLPCQVFLAGVGVVSLILETVSRLTTRLVERGQQASEEVKTPALPAKRPVRLRRRKGVADAFEVSVENTLGRLNLPSKVQIAEIDQQITRLEAQLAELEQAGVIKRSES